MYSYFGEIYFREQLHFLFLPRVYNYHKLFQFTILYHHYHHHISLAVTQADGYYLLPEYLEGGVYKKSKARVLISNISLRATVRRSLYERKNNYIWRDVHIVKDLPILNYYQFERGNYGNERKAKKQRLSASSWKNYEIFNASSSVR